MHGHRRNQTFVQVDVRDMGTTREYVYRVSSVEKITDGDTFWLHLDVGFRQSMLTHIRLADYDTPELYRGSDFEKAEARRATDAVHEFFSLSGIFWCCTRKDPDNFGRWLADIWVEFLGQTDMGLHVERTNLSDFLVERGLASPWPVRWRDAYDQGVAG